MEICYCKIHYEVKPIIDIMIGTALVVTQFALRIIILYAQTRGRLGRRYVPSTEYKLLAAQNTIFPVTNSKLCLVNESKSDVTVIKRLDVDQTIHGGGTGQQFSQQRKSAGYGKDNLRPKLTNRFKETTTVRFESRQRPPSSSRYQRLTGNANTSSRRTSGRQSSTNKRYSNKPSYKRTPVKTIGAVRRTTRSRPDLKRNDDSSANKSSFGMVDEKENNLECATSSSIGRIVAASFAAAAAKITATVSDSKISISTNPMSSSDTDSLRRLVYGPTAIRWFHTDSRQTENEIVIKAKTAISSTNESKTNLKDCKMMAENHSNDDLAIPTTSARVCEDNGSTSSRMRFRKCGVIASSAESHKLESENPELQEKQFVSKLKRDSVMSYSPLKFFDKQTEDQSLVLASKIPAVHTARSYLNIETVKSHGNKGFEDRGSVSVGASRSNLDQTDPSLPFSTHSQKNIVSLSESLNRLQKHLLATQFSDSDIESQGITPGIKTPLERSPQPQGGGGNLMPSDDLPYSQNDSTLPMKRKNRTFYNRLISPIGGSRFPPYIPSRESFLSSPIDTERSAVTLTQSAKSSLTISNTGDSVLRFTQTEDSLLSFEQAANSFFTVRENGMSYISADQSGFTTETSENRSLSFGDIGIKLQRNGPTLREINTVQNQDCNRLLQDKQPNKCTLSTAKSQNITKTAAQGPSNLATSTKQLDDKNQLFSVSRQSSRNLLFTQNGASLPIKKESFPLNNHKINTKDEVEHVSSTSLTRVKPTNDYMKYRKSDLKHTSNTDLAKQTFPSREHNNYDNSEMRHTSSMNVAKQANNFKFYKKTEMKYTSNTNLPKESLATNNFKKTATDHPSSTSLPKTPFPTREQSYTEDKSSIVINRENSKGFPSSVPGTPSGKGFLPGLTSLPLTEKRTESLKSDSAQLTLLSTASKSGRHSYPETKPSSDAAAGRSSLPEPLPKSKYGGISSIIIGSRVPSYKEPFPKLNNSATTTGSDRKKDSLTNMGPGFSRISVKPFAPIETSNLPNGRLDPQVIKTFSSGIGQSRANENKNSVDAGSSLLNGSSLKPFIERETRNYPFSQSSISGSPLDVNCSGKSLSEIISSMRLFCSLTGLRKVKQSDSVSFSLKENANKSSDSLESKKPISFASSTSGIASKISTLSHGRQKTHNGSLSKQASSKPKVKPIPLSNLSLRSERGKGSANLSDVYKELPFSSREPKEEQSSPGKSSVYAESYNGYSKRNKTNLRKRRQKRATSSTDTSTGSTDTSHNDLYDGGSKKVTDKDDLSSLKVFQNKSDNSWIEIEKNDSHSSYIMSSLEKNEEQTFSKTDSSLNKTFDEQRLSRSKTSKEKSTLEAKASMERTNLLLDKTSSSQTSKEQNISKAKSSIDKTNKQKPSSLQTSENGSISKTEFKKAKEFQPSTSQTTKEQNISKTKSSFDKTIDQKTSALRPTDAQTVDKTHKQSTSQTSKDQKPFKNEAFESPIADEPTTGNRPEPEKSRSESRLGATEQNESDVKTEVDSSATTSEATSTVHNESKSDGLLKQRIKSSLSVGLGLLFESASFIASVPLRAPRAFFSNRRLTNRQGSIDRLETAVEEEKKPKWHSCNSSDSSESFYS